MTQAIPGLDVLGRRLRDEIAAGNAVRLEITARDAATAELLRLICELHEAAQKRQVDVVIDQVSADTMRVSLPSDA
jgi:hypothetical protein